MEPAPYQHTMNESICYLMGAGDKCCKETETRLEDQRGRWKWFGWKGTPSTRAVSPGRALTGPMAPACDAEGSSMKERDHHVRRPSKEVELTMGGIGRRLTWLTGAGVVSTDRQGRAVP